MEILNAIAIATTIVKGISAIQTASGWMGRKIVGEEILERRKLNETALEPVLEKAIEEVAETIEPMGAAAIHQIALFLTSPEAEAIVRQIYSATILETRENDLGAIQEEFLTAFSLYTNIPENELKDSAPAIFKILLKGCDEVLQLEIDRGRLSAHEAKSNLRHRILLDELEAMRKNIEFLTKPQKPDVQEILKFEQLYRQQVSNRHKSITPPYIEASGKLPIDQLYVEPNLAIILGSKEGFSQQLTIDKFSESAYRAVVLGDPGIGKSTLTEKLCYDLAKQDPERLWSGRQVTPILVVLREYAIKKKECSCSIMEFIEVMAKSRYQKESPPGAFEYLLLNGRSIVIFDGLDELTDTSDRREIAGDVESFCNLYPSVPVLVTSRKVGYKEAPLDEERFDTFHLADFNEDQVKEYVEKRFALLDLTPEERQQKIAAFLDESRTVRDLRSNALMLGLMCNLYKAAGYIPKNRSDIYEKCTEMLFKNWDKSRKIPLPEAIKNIESHIKPAMMYLAHWIYTDKELQGGVTERKLVAKATEYLFSRRFNNQDDAELAASEFISFCRGRAWVFTDMGTEEDGSNLYQFVHRTFLEYFTAAHLVRIYSSPEKLAEVLLPKIAKQEWDVVAQLAIQKQDRDIDEAADELLAALVEEANRVGGDEGWNLLYFAARCLEFIVPSPKVTREIATACFDRLLTEGGELTAQEKLAKNDNGYLERQHQLMSMTDSLLGSSWENRGTVSEALEELITDVIKSGSDFKLIAALETLMYLCTNDENVKKVRHIFIENMPKIEKICTKYVNVCLNAYHYLNIVSIENIIKWHGLRSIFQDINFSLFAVGWISLSEFIVDYFTINLYDSAKPIETNHKRLRELREVSRAFLSYTLPLKIKKSELKNINSVFDDFEMKQIGSNINVTTTIQLDSQDIFGLFGLFAVMLEASNYPKLLEEAVRLIAESEIAFFDFIRWTFIARFDPEVIDDKVKAELDRCGFSPEQQAFVWRWIRREMNLVEPAAEEELRAIKG